MIYATRHNLLAHWRADRPSLSAVASHCLRQWLENVEFRRALDATIVQVMDLQFKGAPEEMVRLTFQAQTKRMVRSAGSVFEDSEDKTLALMSLNDFVAKALQAVALRYPTPYAWKRAKAEMGSLVFAGDIEGKEFVSDAEPIACVHPSRGCRSNHAG
ncbi:MAG: hypothetical protein HY360_25920 [Verrucomicrobia bacterium]|nr:hypothetical protein [Verrucomicrobiota bacterium]